MGTPLTQSPVVISPELNGPDTTTDITRLGTATVVLCRINLLSYANSMDVVGK